MSADQDVMSTYSPPLSYLNSVPTPISLRHIASEVKLVYHDEFSEFCQIIVKLQNSHNSIQSCTVHYLVASDMFGPFIGWQRLASWFAFWCSHSVDRLLERNLDRERES